MRNILMTVMLLIVVVVMFTSIITASGGTKDTIENKGSSINTEIGSLINP